MAAARRPSLSTGSLAQYAVFEADTPLLAHRPPGLPVAPAPRWSHCWPPRRPG
jgi:hypothetical protein